MNTKTLLGAVIAGVVSFLLGWLIFGILLMDFYTSNMVSYSGLAKNPPDVLPIAIANLSLGLLLSWIFTIAGIKTLAKGFSTGFVIGLLMALSFDFFLYAQFNLYNVKVLAIDIVLNALLGGIAGAVLGWWFSRGSK
jgi:uncharacterized protein with PQ loop repeat